MSRNKARNQKKSSKIKWVILPAIVVLVLLLTFVFFQAPKTPVSYSGVLLNQDLPEGVFPFPVNRLNTAQFVRLVEIRDYLKNSEYSGFSEVAPLLTQILETGIIDAPPIYNAIPVSIATNSSEWYTGALMNIRNDDRSEVIRSGIFIEKKYLSDKSPLPLAAYAVAKELQQILLHSEICGKYAEDVRFLLQKPSLIECKDIKKATDTVPWWGYSIDGGSYGVLLRPYIGLKLSQYGLLYPMSDYIKASKKDGTMLPDGTLTESVFRWANEKNVACMSQFATVMADYPQMNFYPASCASNFGYKP